MTLSDFISKWICSDSFSMMDKQGTLHFQGLTCIARFPSSTGNIEKQLVYAFEIVEIDENGLQSHLGGLDKLLMKTYGVDE